MHVELRRMGFDYDVKKVTNNAIKILSNLTLNVEKKKNITIYLMKLKINVLT